MIKKLKRAFTITELVIVIAVIAILAAVLIPTLSSVISSSKTASDKAYVKEMNTTLSSYITLELGGVAPETYQDLMEALDSEGLCDASNPYLLAKELETEDAYVVWYPSTSSVVLILPDEGYTVTYSSVYGLGNGVAVTDTAGTVGYGVRLCTSTTESEVLVAELYNSLYGDSNGEVTTFISSAAYATIITKVSNSDSTWASVIKAALSNTSVGYSSSSTVKTAIIDAVTSGTTATLNYTKEALLESAGYTANGDGSYTAADGTILEASAVSAKTSELVSSNVLTGLATLSTLAADTTSASSLAGETVTIAVDPGTVVDISDVTLTAIGTSYRKDENFGENQSFSIDFGGLTLTGYTVEANSFTSTGANFQTASDLGYTEDGYAFTYGILGSVMGGDSEDTAVTYSNLTITDININLNGSTEAIDGTTYATICDMAGIVCGYTKGYVNFENITVDGAGSNSTQGTFSGYDAVAGIVGRAYKNDDGSGELNLTNCSVSNLAITGQRRAAGLIGYTNGISVNISGCSVSNVNITIQRNDKEKGVYGGVIGHFGSKTPVTISGTLAITNCTTVCRYGDGESATTWTYPTDKSIYALLGNETFDASSSLLLGRMEGGVFTIASGAKITVDSYSYTTAGSTTISDTTTLSFS